MPIKRSAYKELRKAKARHIRNIAVKSELKTLSKRFEKLLSEKKPAEAKEALNTLTAKFTRAAAKGFTHKNTASRKISRSTIRLNALSKA